MLDAAQACLTGHELAVLKPNTHFLSGLREKVVPNLVPQDARFLGGFRHRTTRTGNQPCEPLYDFIASLGSDSERAGDRYESIRRELIAYFKWRQCPIPEDLSDQVIDRTARKFRQIRDLPKFVRGTARRVCSEYFRGNKAVSMSEDLEPRSYARAGDDEEERRLEVLGKALQSLSPTDRQIILEYYRFDGAARIRTRRQLAAALNTSIETLAVRALRIRRALREHWETSFADVNSQRANRGLLSQR